MPREVKPRYKRDEDPLIHVLIEEGNVNEVARLIDEAEDDIARITLLMSEATNGHLPIHVACRHSFECVRILINAGASPNDLGMHGQSALQIAASNSLELVKYLIEAGASITMKDNFGHDVIQGSLTGFHRDINMDIMKYLIEKGADVNNTDIHYGTTTLHTAVWRGSFELVKLLVESGADVNVRAKNGETALDKSISMEREEIAKYLSEYTSV